MVLTIKMLLSALPISTTVIHDTVICLLLRLLNYLLKSSFIEGRVDVPRSHWQCLKLHRAGTSDIKKTSGFRSIP